MASKGEGNVPLPFKNSRIPRNRFETMTTGQYNRLFSKANNNKQSNEIHLGLTLCDELNICVDDVMVINILKQLKEVVDIDMLPPIVLNCQMEKNHLKSIEILKNLSKSEKRPVDTLFLILNEKSKQDIFGNAIFFLNNILAHVTRVILVLRLKDPLIFVFKIQPQSPVKLREQNRSIIWDMLSMVYQNDKVFPPKALDLASLRSELVEIFITSKSAKLLQDYEIYSNKISLRIFSDGPDNDQKYVDQGIALTIENGSKLSDWANDRYELLSVKSRWNPKTLEEFTNLQYLILKIGDMEEIDEAITLAPTFKHLQYLNINMNNRCPLVLELNSLLKLKDLHLSNCPEGSKVRVGNREEVCLRRLYFEEYHGTFEEINKMSIVNLIFNKENNMKDLCDLQSRAIFVHPLGPKFQSPFQRYMSAATMSLVTQATIEVNELPDSFGNHLESPPRDGNIASPKKRNNSNPKDEHSHGGCCRPCIC